MPKGAKSKGKIRGKRRSLLPSPLTFVIHSHHYPVLSFTQFFPLNGSPYAIGPLPVYLSVCLSCPVCPVCNVGVLWQNDWTDQDETSHAGIGLGPGHIMIDGDTGPPPQRGTAPPNCRPISVLAKWLDGSRCHVVWR